MDKGHNRTGLHYTGNSAIPVSALLFHYGVFLPLRGSTTRRAVLLNYSEPFLM